MIKILATIFISILCIKVYAQDTTMLYISTTGVDIGKIELITYNNSPTKEHYKIHSKTNLMHLYKVEYKLETWYTHHTLDSSEAFYMINNSTKHHCKIKRIDNFFNITKNGIDIGGVSIPPIESYCRLFFNPTMPKNTIYSEYDGEIKKIHYKNDSTFQIITQNKKIEATYTLRDSIITKGFINHVLLKFNINK